MDFCSISSTHAFSLKEKKRDCNSSIQQLFQHCGKSNNMNFEVCAKDKLAKSGYYKHQMKEESSKSTFYTFFFWLHTEKTQI
jgi:hypothetical protein